MKVLSHLWCARIAVGVLALGALSAHADEWSKTYTLSGKPSLKVGTSDASIRVTTWDQSTIEARVVTTRYKSGEGSIKIEEHQTGDSVDIEVRYPHHDFNLEWGNHRVEIIVQMPREGNVDLSTGDGRIDLSGLKGQMVLHSGDGSEDLDGLDGQLRASTGDGHIRASGRFDDLDLKTGDGHLDVRALAGSTLSTAWRLETGDGHVSLEIPASLSADLDLHTSDGHIDLDMPVTTEGSIRGNEIHGKLNGGGNSLRIHTGDGSIHLIKGSGSV